jgi:16S rRNA (uracil1498-N3)-methyltransferase
LRHLYLPPPWLSVGETLELSSGTINHLINVLRLKPHTPLIAVDGEGGKGNLELIQLGKKKWGVKFLSKAHFFAAPEIRISLMVSLLKHNTMERVMRQATELGVSQIIPIITDRSTVSLKAGQAKRGKWEKIVLSAFEQSEGLYIPHISPIITFSQGMKLCGDFDSKILFYARSKKKIPYPLPGKDILVFTGPEGGFSEKELDMVEEVGFTTYSMSNRILRADTAAACAVSMVSFLVD